MAGPEPGLFDSLRRLLGTSVELAQLRIELLASDLELEKRRLIGAALRALLALLLIGMGLLLAVGLVLILVDKAHRALAVGGMAVAFVLAGLWLLRAAQHRLQEGESMFGATVTELARDRDALGRD